DGERLPVDVSSPPLPRVEGRAAVSVSATRAGEEGQVTLSLVNAHLEVPASVAIDLGQPVTRVEGRILASDDVHDHNTPDEPERVVPRDCKVAPNADGTVTVELPPHSVAALTVSL